MSVPGADFPPAELPYSLRVTLSALDDLGVPRGAAVPGDLYDVVAATERSAIVEKFRDLRSESPNGTEPPMNNVGVPDVFSLHGRFGDRAATWFDKTNQVCWLLGVVGQHEYTEFEHRAANDELLPSASVVGPPVARFRLAVPDSSSPAVTPIPGSGSQRSRLAFAGVRIQARRTAQRRCPVSGSAHTHSGVEWPFVVDGGGKWG